MTNRNISELTLKKEIENHNPEKQKTVSCGDGLIARIIGRQHKVTFFYREPNERKLIRLGAYPDLSLKDCRVLINRQRKQEKVLEVNEVTHRVKIDRSFKKVADEWLNSKKDLCHYPNYRKCVEFLSELFPVNVSQIKNVMIKDILLDPKKKITPYKMRETIFVLCSIMDLAVENDLIDRHNCNVLKTSNSFPKIGKTDGFKFVFLKDINEIFEKLQEQPFKIRAYFIMLCLTCLRPGECRQLKFEYFDLENKSINVPGELMKVKKKEPFRIPLTDQILRVYKKCVDHRENELNPYLFTSQRKPEGCLREAEISTVIRYCTGGKMHAHGFRKTARSWFAEQNVPTEVAAKCLDHVVDTGADRLYQKSDLFKLRADVLTRYNFAVFANIKNLDFYLRD